uniref:Uncharacterized protein n=1 Tax=Cacopsylla melanoneura TaxID=428564 RepID=A0A8D8WDI1_9HEMI
MNVMMNSVEMSLSLDFTTCSFVLTLTRWWWCLVSLSWRTIDFVIGSTLSMMICRRHDSMTVCTIERPHTTSVPNEQAERTLLCVESSKIVVEYDAVCLPEHLK